MAQISFSRKRDAGRSLSAQTRSELEKRDDRSLEASVWADEDNPPVSDVRLDRMVIAREVRRIREAAALSQPTFAATYRIALGRLRDWEQGRTSPDIPLLVYLRMIHADPVGTARMVEDVEGMGFLS